MKTTGKPSRNAPTLPPISHRPAAPITSPAMPIVSTLTRLSPANTLFAVAPACARTSVPSVPGTVLRPPALERSPAAFSIAFRSPLSSAPFRSRALAATSGLLFAALLVEHHGRELLQRLARFVQRSPVGIHPRELLDEADIAGVRLEIHRGKREASLFHSLFPPEIRTNRLRDQAFKSMTARSYFPVD